MRMYSNEEFKIIDTILDKEEKNKIYTQEEWNFVKDLDFSDKALPGIAKLVWKHGNNPKAITLILKILKDEEIEEYNNIFDKVLKVNNICNSNN